MIRIWRSLIWKEWHEQKWKLVVLLVLASVMPIMQWYGGDSVRPDAFSVFLAGLLVTYSFVAPLFLAMRVATEYRTQGTFEFVQSLPFPPGRFMIVKLFASLLTFALPLFPVITFVSLATRKNPVTMQLEAMQCAAVVGTTLSCFL